MNWVVKKIFNYFKPIPTLLFQIKEKIFEFYLFNIFLFNAPPEKPRMTFPLAKAASRKALKYLDSCPQILSRTNFAEMTPKDLDKISSRELIQSLFSS
jgi:hypothetical protein